MKTTSAGFKVSLLACAAAIVSMGCSDGDSASSASTTGQGSSSSSSSGVMASSSSGGMPDGGTPGHDTMTVDGESPPTWLPKLPELTHVKAEVRGNSARITFDPYVSAKDYRVYVAPKSQDDLLLNPDGSLAGIKSATYRCAGYRAASQIWVDGSQGPASNPVPDWEFMNTRVDGADIANYKRSLAEATIGYGFGDPGPGLLPVYAVGDSAVYADSYEYGVREPETRSKLYVLDPAPHLAKGFRDGGVAFYAPDSASSAACGTSAPVQIHTKDSGGRDAVTHLYYPAGGAEAQARGAGTPAFFLCPAATAASQPIMRVYYDNILTGAGHDELALGRERFMRARCQGSDFDACKDAPQSVWEVHWSNITEHVELIVEALDAGCPFQGLMGASPLGPMSEGDAYSEPLTTIDAVRASAPNGEVFLNGQFDGTTPRPIARSALKVEPAKRAEMDFASDFVKNQEPFSKANDCGVAEAFAKVGASTDYACQDDTHLSTPTYDILARGFYALGYVEGELSSFSGGALRVSPKNVAADVASDSFLHVVLEASSFTTDRRYPQIIISQQDMMTSQWLLVASDDTNPKIQPVLILQPFDQQRKLIQLQLCNQRRWDVNYQCPYFLFEKLDPSGGGQGQASSGFAPYPESIEHLQTDDSARFDLYLSTKRAYVFFEDQPYGCADLANRTSTDDSGGAITPVPASPAGSVSVSFGTVLYHPAAQGGLFQILSPFHMKHEFDSDLKHFDYFAFKSGEPAPAWDEERFPCMKQMHQNDIPGEP